MTGQGLAANMPIVKPGVMIVTHAQQGLACATASPGKDLHTMNMCVWGV